MGDDNACPQHYLGPDFHRANAVEAIRTRQLTCRRVLVRGGGFATKNGFGGSHLGDSTSPHIADCVLHRICRFAATHKAVRLFRRRSTPGDSGQSLLQGGSAGCPGQSAGRPRSLSWAGVVSDHPNSYLVSGALFLWLDLSHGQPESLPG